MSLRSPSPRPPHKPVWVSRIVAAGHLMAAGTIYAGTPAQSRRTARARGASDARRSQRSSAAQAHTPTAGGAQAVASCAVWDQGLDLKIPPEAEQTIWLDLGGA